ncbi:hypothetical protein ACO2J1_03860 [Leptospira interrogans]|uniref:Uncharacterized protein n=18 Tax=Leptospira interrogans TaxID=173 RepID=Q8F4J5_LEPIN|nr:MULTISPECIES: hypothetical protein [Leptospira]APH41719.1 Uncharacterized protein A9P81_2015 [Leptospira interrogans serovar Copenhageni/Icterohaemorrhagiae]EMF40730.1 hypothetical protein LEP1GSC067_3376 [Leptospira interrogans serovar Lora str. TE 1992]EMF70145.1 hypothetical protein LEP1GSC148_0676 [Leptospira interrogans serovar Canicola str. LT1962]EMG11209.1 hypothetical protein LEP1GSC151_0502 [Leptospira interrogans serovar Grippotyphosa str. LT2186]EMG20425.1 hypothetical protein L
MSSFSALLKHSVWRDLWTLFLNLGKVILFLSLFFLYVWQNVQVARLNREIGIATNEKIKQIKKNDDLKIGVATYTSARRIETLYRKTYNYLPITVGDRIVTLNLPPEKNEDENEVNQSSP